MYDHKRIIINFLILTVSVFNMVQYEFVFANNNGEVRCIEREREALLQFKKALIDDNDVLSSWGSEAQKKECCKWKGVSCSNNTGHVIALLLSGEWPFSRYYLGGKISSALLELHNLKVLDLTFNNFGRNRIPEFIGSMTQLEHLNLSRSNFSGIVPPQLWNLTNLKTLDISYNVFRECKIPEFIGSMKKLAHLNLMSSNFSGIVPPQLGNLTNLKTLDLSRNYFFGIVPPHLGNLTNLQTLVLSYNFLRFENLNWLNSRLSLLSRLGLSYLNISYPNWLQHLLKLHSLQELYLRGCGLNGITPSLHLSPNSSYAISLSILDLSENDLTSSTIDWLFNMSTSLITTNLSELHLSSTKLKELPSSIWRLSSLEELDVSFNVLEGTITEANLNKLHNLKVLDLSFNSLTLDINPDWVPPFQLDVIGLADCNIGPRFPLWLRTQRSNVLSLDLSCNGISGEVPKWLWSLSPVMNYLNLSHNQLSGTVPYFSSQSLFMVDVSFNKLSGPIPLFPPGTLIFQLSQNMFSGSISSICTFHYVKLLLLDLSNNQLIGGLPDCWENLPALGVLSLANNSFSGEIPHALGSLSYLGTLHLSNNNLSGELPSTLQNCKYLQLMDIGNNMLTGDIPTWIGAYHEYMKYLSFRHNRFQGSIPPQICSLNQIQMLDLSRNNISGTIPPCFGNFTGLVLKNTTKSFHFSFPLPYWQVHEYIDYAIVSWKCQESEYRRNLKLLKLIDLSSNRLVGDIPGSFSFLRGLISLNLSRNSLTGIIDPDIGQMEMLEILDLSSNRLSGVIPIGMAQLHFLAVLDLANNNLSGKIPIGSQLQTFNASSYAGNIGLCGSPLPLCPGDRTDDDDDDDDKDDDGILSLSFLKEIGIWIILGFILGFWGVVGSLIVKESWRRAFFLFWGAVGDWLYVNTTIFWIKFRRS